MAAFKLIGTTGEQSVDLPLGRVLVVGRAVTSDVPIGVTGTPTPTRWPIAYAARRLPAAIRRRAQAKLMILNNAKDLNDVRVPPGNRLEALSGTRRGQYSIRINVQWRICFVWKNGDAYQVEITDYH